MKKVNGGVVTDFKQDDKWKRSYIITTADAYVQYYTRAGRLWNSMQARCKPGGSEQAARVNYVGVTVGFTDFQEFAEWCNSEDGYTKQEEDGTWWSLDKDILLHGSRVYTPETCIFVPRRVNCVMIACASTRGEYPVGVHYSKPRQGYIAQCMASVPRYIGCFPTPELAHRAWQESKAKQLFALASDMEFSSKLRKGLMQNYLRIQADIDEGRETIC